MAQSAGRSDDAIAICRERMDQHPDVPQWVSAPLQALLSAGRTQEADELLGARINAAGDAPAELERLGKLADPLGRDAMAVRAARKLTAFGGGPAIAGDLIQASSRGMSSMHP